MANKVTTTNTTNKVVITPQSTKKLTIDLGNSNNLTVNQSIPNNVQITNNDVDTSLTPNNVSISSTGNNVSLSSTSTPVTVTQGTTSVVTVNTPGPRGPQGSGLTPGADIEARNITASGNISASGNIITENLISPTNENTRIQLLENNLVFYANADSFQSLNLTPSFTLFNSANDPNKDFKIGTGTTDDFFVIDSGDDTLTILGNITASGNISASGDIIGNNLKATSISASGDVFVSQYIKHIGDPDTFINFTDNRIRFKAGNIGFFDMEKDASVPYPATINPGGNRINFRVVDRNTELLLKTDSEASKVNLYHAGNQKLETITDGINITGSLTLTGSGHITASGNISASRDIAGNTLTIGGTQVIDLHSSGFRIGNNFENTNIFGSTLDISPNVTASGDISSSGTIEGSILKGTLSTPTQTGITQVGNLTTLTVDNLNLNSNTLSSTSDSDVFISLGAAGIGFNANDNDSFTFNSAQNNIDFDFVGSSDQHLFYIDTSEDKIGIGINTPSEKLEVAGNISASGTGSFEYLKLNYDIMPTSDPNIKGVVYRSSSNGMDNLLFISPG